MNLTEKILKILVDLKMLKEQIEAGSAHKDQVDFYNRNKEHAWNIAKTYLELQEAVNNYP